MLPTVAALATLDQPVDEAVKTAQECGEVTRRSKTVQSYVEVVVHLIRNVINEGQGLDTATRKIASARFPRLNLDARRMDLVTA